MSYLKTLINATSWREELKELVDSPLFSQIEEYLNKARENDEIICPCENLIFRAFELTPFNEVKVVILGQDPYSDIDEETGLYKAMGLSFSIPNGINVSKVPSLNNIFKELKREFNYEIPKSNGNLTRWAKQGGLLLNSTLTVGKGKAKDKANSHAHFGWQYFTDGVIKILSQKKENLVFMLWGDYAHRKASLIDTSRGHKILMATHPAYPAPKDYKEINKYGYTVKKFNGCGHFKDCNEHLAINWRLTE